MKGQNEMLVTEIFFNTLDKLERVFNAKNCKGPDIERIIDIEFKHDLKATKNTYGENKYMHLMCDMKDIIKITTRTYSDDSNILREYKLAAYGTELILTREDKRFMTSDSVIGHTPQEL